jgi:XRE family transcriptional regulator, regulator of sulfur utilization
MSPGEKISQLRKSKGLSQELLAENSGTSLRTIQRIEGGTTIPRLYTLKTIASALGVTLAEIQPPEREAPAPENIRQIRLINLSALSIIILPIANILLPLMVWRTRKRNELIDAAAMKILSFQILWSVITLVVLVSARLITLGITGSVAIGHFPMLSILYFPLLLINLFFILKAAIQLRTDPNAIYSSFPTIL